MDIQPAILSSSLSVKATQLNSSQWFIGQILNATVTSHKPAGPVLLQIGNQQVEANANQSKPLIVGEQLKLVVEKQDNPAVLRVLQQSSPKIVFEAKQQLLRESIPKQAGMEKLTNVLNQVSSNVKETIKALPAPIEQQFRKMIEQLPTRTNVNNEAGLKTAIKNSGLFLEEKLFSDVINKKLNIFLKTSEQLKKTTLSNRQISTNNQGVSKDLKTNLLQLLNVFSKYTQNAEIEENTFRNNHFLTATEAGKNPATKTNETAKAMELILKANTEAASKQVESSLARIEVNQSKAIVTHDNQSPLWSVEIPVKDKQNIDLLKLDIQKDKESKSKNTEQQLWSSNLKINFENIGSISAKLSVINKEINATLWSDNETLSSLIKDNLSLLDKQIERCGLSTGKIVCLDEAPLEAKVQLPSKNFINISI